VAIRIDELTQPGMPSADDGEVFLSIKSRAAAERICGTLSAPEKMPSHGYSIPTAYCGVGSKLRAVVGSTCTRCYAHERGNYRFGNVKAGLERRYRSLTDARWVGAIAWLIAQARERYPVPTVVKLRNGAMGVRDGRYFRWHDSGDLQSPVHLARICAVARLTPDVVHWLPTREYRIVKSYLLMGGTIPANLVVRLSAHMVDGSVPDIAGLPVSTVHTVAAPEGARSCPAPTQGNQCKSCRACWTPAVRHVSYHQH